MIGTGTAMLVSAGLGLAQGGMGMAASNKANKANNAIAAANLAAQQRENFLARLDRQEQVRMSKLPFTDAKGNRWVFSESEGWKMIPTGMTKSIMDASDREELARYAQDMPLQRQENNANYARRLEEDAIAKGLMQEYNRARPEDTQNLRNLLIERANRGVNKGYDDATAIAAKQNLRSGTSGAAMFAELAKKRAESQRDAIMDAELQAESERQNRSIRAREGLANLYNNFANRASNNPQIGFAPTNAGGSDAIGQNMRSNMMGVMSPMILNAPQRSQVPMNNDASKMLGGIQSMFSGYTDMQRQDQLMNALLNRSAAGNTSSKLVEGGYRMGSGS